MSEQKILREIDERIKQNLTEGHLDHLELDSIPIREFTKDIKRLIESYPSIEYLTINDCELTSLNHFPKLPNLTILQLSNNNITDDQLFHILKNSHISHLMIDDNRLRSIEKVSILRQLPNLEQLEIANNLMGDSDFYREELFDRIPQLKIIDCKDKFGNIAIDSESDLDDGENSMIVVGDMGKAKQCENEKSPQRGNIGEKGHLELLELLGDIQQSSQQSVQSREIDRRPCLKSEMQQWETDHKQKLFSNADIEASQQAIQESGRKRIKIFSQTIQTKNLMEYSKTQVIDSFDIKEQSF